MIFQLIFLLSLGTGKEFWLCSKFPNKSWRLVWDRHVCVGDYQDRTGLLAWPLMPVARLYNIEGENIEIIFFFWFNFYIIISTTKNLEIVALFNKNLILLNFIIYFISIILYTKDFVKKMIYHMPMHNHIKSKFSQKADMCQLNIWRMFNNLQFAYSYLSDWRIINKRFLDPHIYILHPFGPNIGAVKKSCLTKR